MVAPVSARSGSVDLNATVGQHVRSSANTYLQTLAGAGGQEVEAFRRGDGRLSLHAVIYASQPYALRVPALEVPRLAINLTAARVSGGIDGDRARQFDARRHSLFLTPAGAGTRWHKEAPSRHLCLYFHPQLFDGADDGVPAGLELPCLLNKSVPGLGPLVDQLVWELQSSETLNEEAADSVARLLLIRLARRYGRAASAAAALTPKAFDRLKEYIVARLGERILVADLAQQAGLSPNHFAVAFTELTGQPPHRFVLAFRVQRAAALLRQSSLGIAQIANDCGFASQQHLNNAFRRHLATTPGRYRAQARSPADR